MGPPAQVRLLCVDPDPTLLRYFESLFQDIPIRTASGAAAASESLRLHPDIGVVLLDPQTATPQMIRDFRGVQPEGLIVWIAQHAVPPETDAVAGQSVFRTLQRPVREADLVQTVRQAVAVCSLRRQSAAVASGSSQGEESWAERAAQLTELNRLKDELVMIAAHDIRAPLSVILGYCDILQGNEPGMTESGKEILGRIQASANRLLAMVNNVLNLAALEEGRMELKLAPTQLGTVIREVMDSLAGMVEERQLEWHLEINGDDRPYELDAVKLSQVLQNLLSNAIKFNRPGGKIRIFANAVPDEILIEVQDTGRGMAPEQAQRAFQKFVRFASGSATGSGLGLAIAKGFVELHGGTISLETRRNEGTTFRFTLKPGHRPDGPATSLLR